MQSTAMLLVLLCFAFGCIQDVPTQRKVSPDLESPNTIKLGDETFPVTWCSISGYLGKKDGVWYCRWCLSAEGLERTFRSNDGEEEYDYQVMPQLSANTVPIDVERWRDLDGVSFSTGDHGKVDFYRGHDAFYTIQTMSPYETCSNNQISINHIGGTKFRLRWRGEAYLHGIEAGEFELDAIAELNNVIITSQVDSESDVDDIEIGRIFAIVFPHGDFTQHPAEIRRDEEDGVVYIDFTAKFTPKITAEQ